MPAPVEIDYTDRDYDSVRDFLVSVARVALPDWITAGEPGDFGTLLLELYAYVGDIMNYYIDRVAAEPFLSTAVRRQSILGIADMLGYRPIGQQSATLFLEFSLEEGAFPDTTITIEAGTLVSTEAQRAEEAIYFETFGIATLGQAVRSAVVGGREGRTVEREYVGVSRGAPLQDFTLLNVGVVERSTQVLVVEADGAEVEWDFVDHVTDGGPDASIYTTSVDENLYTHLRFGDSSAGRIPPVNAIIYCNYRFGDGARGNVATGAVTVVTDPIPGVLVVNTEPGIGGADAESIDSMRYSIPRAVRTADRAVTLDDFATLAQQVPGVAKAIARGQYYTLVHVHIAPVGGGDPNQDLKDRVDAYLEQRVMVGCTVSVDDPEWLNAEVTMVVHVLPEYGRSLVLQQVRDAITATFAFDSVGFGTRISIGEVFRDAIEVVGVDYIELTVLRRIGAAGAAVQDIVPTTIEIPRLADANLNVTAVGGLV